jgi:hypothetical protein
VPDEDSHYLSHLNVPFLKKSGADIKLLEIIALLTPPKPGSGHSEADSSGKKAP